MHLPFKVDTWQRATDWLGESESTYWEKVPVNPYLTDGDLIFAIDKLLDVSRPQSAIDCLHYRLNKKLPLDIKRTVRALMATVSNFESANLMDSYNVTELIKALHEDSKTDPDDLIKIEWTYLQLLDRNGNAKPKLLEQYLSTKPEFFCEVIRSIFRSKNHERRDEEPDEKRKAIVSNAWRLLHEWKRPPGLLEDGKFSSEDFEKWLISVKYLCKETGHLDVAMIKVGEVLFYCPPDPQGLWIAKSAASALNARDAEKMRNGFRTEVFNSRGVHWVDPTGKQERDIAIQWRENAEALENSGYARFAATLRELADSYDREAERIIEESKQENK
jgi:hypothetical protein